MSKRTAIIFAALIVGAAAVYFSLTGPHGKLVARLQKKDAGGFVHWVTVRQFAGRFRTELSDEGSRTDLPDSSYEFYEGSAPITAASITWPDLHRFTVKFNNGITIDATWNETNFTWTVH